MSPPEREVAHTYYVCYNQVSYLVACEHALRLDSAAATVLVAADRVVRQVRYAALAHRNLNRWQLVLACTRSLWTRGAVVYFPHQRGGRLLRVLRRLARSARLVDDGLDTLRERPKNLDLQRLTEFEELLTFHDYPKLARWTHALRVTRVCPLSVMIEDVRPAMPSGNFKTLVIQSPGVDVASAAALTQVEPSEVYVFVHGNPAKRTELPPGCVQGASRAWSIERTVAAFDGTVISGETMTTVAALHLPRRGSLIVQLSDHQYENMACIHQQLTGLGVRLMLRRD